MMNERICVWLRIFIPFFSFFVLSFRICASYLHIDMDMFNKIYSNNIKMMNKHDKSEEKRLHSRIVMLCSEEQRNNGFGYHIT